MKAEFSNAHDTSGTTLHRFSAFLLASVVLILVILASPSWILDPYNKLFPKSHETFEITPVTRENASAIFNTVQGALRNKNAQIEPIGVSFIPAYIPEGTLLYHGNGDGQIPEGPEWIAMDHEFSQNFIADRAGPHIGHGHRSSTRAAEKGRGHPGRFHGPPRDSEDKHTSLLTFRVKKPLSRMILLDGSSAAKTETGEMDQQYILAGIENVSSPFVGERESSVKICEWGKQFGLDGYIRVEVGFEVVICDFFDKLELTSNVTLDWGNNTLNLPLELTDEHLMDEYASLWDSVSAMGSYDWAKMGNVHDKREGRILLDFSKLQTMLNRTYVGTDPYTRRIYNVSKDLRQDLKRDLAQSLEGGVDPYGGTNWQLLTTEIVDKFSPILQMINSSLSDEHSDGVSKAKNLTVFTTNFVRRFLSWEEGASIEERILAAKNRALEQYVHPLQPLRSKSDALILSSIRRVTQMIIETVFDSFFVSRDILDDYFLKNEIDFTGLDELKYQVVDLLEVLRWESTYYTCSSRCSWDEICYTPSWGPSPLGWDSSFGTFTDSYGKVRISAELQCVSYKTILALGHKEW
ncbi:uncharacterized protein CYBJADRAFT_169194 [Cyberlindnera jadinii NRRL Y-1542]|uniref:Uncharacterized protein n=1 Tax=Cyberlindnera jadinii (strain ATCC 18201 / CBS 1600 / BCRC 20928 / JCM 3617 / NBRC 0987 / NRRL Y-1542) TaxID=983966 RepID=A0A1E4RWA2_CYBJN|nr:hypothetical protein CYBJADRAFT_169194 [Cyberlindnera jadinii NRRL Y-1542]ODV71557.1 hypothetical protein CYBJADRAFT_169194 [Cyberlindnera jadinii NRRL Y-1542]